MTNIPLEIYDELTLFRYREEFHLSYQEAMNEPFEEIERAMFIWSLQDRRAKLENKRNG